MTYWNTDIQITNQTENELVLEVGGVRFSVGPGEDFETPTSFRAINIVEVKSSGTPSKA